MYEFKCRWNQISIGDFQPSYLSKDARAHLWHMYRARSLSERSFRTKRLHGFREAKRLQTTPNDHCGSQLIHGDFHPSYWNW